ncbi:LOW QUALITY PROTEIN: uncharacterized protein LOC124489786 [Dermatophagoides farinae]|uniref:LOW QUALITY PROTEIN: uncharacterized protein LOC124489786 n=1 Tax=Dermatophagoides farinae TaxID=6954 RepID=UPI003F60A736
MANSVSVSGNFNHNQLTNNIYSSFLFFSHYQKQQMSALYNSPSPQPLLQSPLPPPSSSSHYGGGNSGSSSAAAAAAAAASTVAHHQQQQYCLKWNNHRNNMVKVFNELLSDENFVDVTLACDGVSIKAHKLVLSACSTYFRDLFINNPCKHPIVILKDINYEDLQAIINFMYSGEVNVSYSQLGPLLKTAEALKIKGLTDVNEKHGNAFFNGIGGNGGPLAGQFPSNDIPGSPYIPNGTTTPTVGANDSVANFYNRMALESLTNQAIAASSGNVSDGTNTGSGGNGEPSNAYLAFMAQRFKKRRKKHKNGSAMALANVFNANGVAAAAAFNSLAAAAAAAAAASSCAGSNTTKATTTNGFGSSPPTTTKRHQSLSSSNNAKMLMFNRQQSTNNHNHNHHMDHHGGRHNGNGNGDHNHHNNDNDDLGIDSGDESISNLSLPSKRLKESNMNDSDSFNNNSDNNGHNNNSNHHQRSSSTPPQSMINGNTQHQHQDEDQEDDGGDDVDDDDDDGGGGGQHHSHHMLATNGDTSSNIGDNENGDSMAQDAMMMSMNDSDDEFYPDVKPIVSLDESPSPTNSTMDDNSSFNSSSFAAAVGPILENSLTGSNSTPNNSTKVCVCHLCHLTFTAYSSLRRHMTRHYADRERYECDICLKSYSRKDYLKEHKKLKHSDVAKVMSSQRGQKSHHNHHHQQQQTAASSVS